MIAAFSILPGTGRWREAPEGVCLLAQRLRPAPSVSASRCHLPVNGEDF
ncbi:MAG: hypothetical protein JWM94_597 [Sphingomonas bacterium]|nr:hypothetical protein [Sphingomonas bacterium]